MHEYDNDTPCPGCGKIHTAAERGKAKLDAFGNAMKASADEFMSDPDVQAFMRENNGEPIMFGAPEPDAAFRNTVRAWLRSMGVEKREEFKRDFTDCVLQPEKPTTDSPEWKKIEPHMHDLLQRLTENRVSAPPTDIPGLGSHVLAPFALEIGRQIFGKKTLAECADYIIEERKARRPA